MLLVYFVCLLFMSGTFADSPEEQQQTTNEDIEIAVKNLQSDVVYLRKQINKVSHDTTLGLADLRQHQMLVERILHDIIHHDLITSSSGESGEHKGKSHSSHEQAGHKDESHDHHKDHSSHGGESHKEGTHDSNHHHVHHHDHHYDENHESHHDGASKSHHDHHHTDEGHDSGHGDEHHHDEHGDHHHDAHTDDHSGNHHHDEGHGDHDHKHHHDTHTDDHSGGDHHHDTHHDNDHKHDTTHDDHHHDDEHHHGEAHSDDHSAHDDHHHHQKDSTAPTEEDGQHHSESSHDHESKVSEKPQEVVEPEIVSTVYKHNEHDDGNPHYHPHQGTTATKDPKDPLKLFNKYMRHHHHHHHHNTTNKSSSIFPKFMDLHQYSFALCDVQPNNVTTEPEVHHVTGYVSFWQKKTGGALGIHVNLQGFNVEGHDDHLQHIDHEQQHDEHSQAAPSKVGHVHGFHVHESGDLSDGCQSAGAHYNPHSMNHGGPKSEIRHVGDLGNIECDQKGHANMMFKDPVASLSGEFSILERTIVIHANPDDYGTKPNDPESLRTGNAGARIACCVIKPMKRLPFKVYKAAKTAKYDKSS